jgi:hypothetical protein
MEDGTSQSAHVHDFVMIYAVCAWNYLSASFYRLSSHLSPLFYFPLIQQILTCSLEPSTVCIQLGPLTLHTSGTPCQLVRFKSHKTSRVEKKFYHRHPQQCFGGALAN